LGVGLGPMRDGNDRRQRLGGWPGRLALALVAGGWFSAQAVAQQAVRPEVEPGQVQKRIPVPPEPERPLAPLQLPAPRSAGPPGEVSFVLAGVVIDGVTAFDVSTLAPLYQDLLARKIDSQDIERILQRITATYRDGGYFLSRAVALPQALDTGVLRITVIEGYVARVALQNARFGDEPRLRSYVDGIVDRRPLRLDAIERAILLINDLPGVHVVPSLRPLDESSGAYELVLRIEYHDLAGFASLDNRGPDSLGPWEAQVSGSISSLLMPFDRLQLSLFTIPDRPRELISPGVSYELPIGSAGTRLALSATRTDVKPEGNLASLTLDGTAIRYLAQLSHHLIRGREESLWLKGAFDVLDSKENQQGALLFDDRLRVLRGGIAYARTDALGGANDVSLEVSQGLSALGASRAGDTPLSRGNGRADFTKLAGNVTRVQTLGGDWALQLAAIGQKAVEPLLISEQLALGGTGIGRGYDPAEITGDDGAAGAVELRYGRAVDGRLIRSFQFYGFYDFGAVWNMGVSDATRRQTLASLGGGLRLGLPHQLAASLEIARPLTRIVAADGDKPVRVFLSLSAAF
jgi:hemolysin activation/secretion protein